MADSTFNAMEQDELLEDFNLQERGSDLRGLLLKKEFENDADPTEEEILNRLNEMCEKVD